MTIVTVAYNLLERGREAFVRQCIKSVSKQTYPFIEHIIIDGASNDGTLELLREYEQKSGGSMKVYSEPDKGVYDAMNKGLARAKGKYINFLNTDDYFHNKDAVWLSVKALEEGAADYSFADAMQLHEDGNRYVWAGDISKLLWAYHYCHQTMFVRTELLREIGGFDTSYQVSADTDMMIRLYAQKRFWVKVPACIVTYRMGGFSSQCQSQARLDHSNAFYEHIGKYIGLNRHECFLCWDLRLFRELPREQQLDLICKVPGEYGQAHLLRRYKEDEPKVEVHSDPVDEPPLPAEEPKPALPMNKRCYLFGILLFKQERMNDESCFWLLGILKMMRKVERNNRTKYYLFGCLPV